MRPFLIIIGGLTFSSCAGEKFVYGQPPVAAAKLQTESVLLLVDGWRLVGTFLTGEGRGSRPAALLLNKAAGTRQAYAALAQELAERGISSLSLDLRAHGESVNLGKFTPGAPDAADILNGTWKDIAAALNFLQSRSDVNVRRIAVIGASYSAEAMAEAARQSDWHALAYVALSPGSLSEQTALSIDGSGAHWLVARAARERSPAVKAATDRVAALSKKGEVWVLDASTHATDILSEVPESNDRIANWIEAKLL